jgi:hypothetical protein
MTVQEAKDFLVAQVMQQAALEGLAISDVEKRMMYFTESEDAVEDPIALNEEFEAQYDTEEYERKISGLFKAAHKRLRKENPISIDKWKEYVRFLKKGDHYILILCD